MDESNTLTEGGEEIRESGQDIVEPKPTTTAAAAEAGEDENLEYKSSNDTDASEDVRPSASPIEAPTDVQMEQIVDESQLQLGETQETQAAEELRIKEEAVDALFKAPQASGQTGSLGEASTSATSSALAFGGARQQCTCKKAKNKCKCFVTTAVQKKHVRQTANSEQLQRQAIADLLDSAQIHEYPLLAPDGSSRGDVPDDMIKENTLLLMDSNHATSGAQFDVAIGGAHPMLKAALQGSNVGWPQQNQPMATGLVDSDGIWFPEVQEHAYKLSYSNLSAVDTPVYKQILVPQTRIILEYDLPRKFLDKKTKKPVNQIKFNSWSTAAMNLQLTLDGPHHLARGQVVRLGQKFFKVLQNNNHQKWFFAVQVQDDEKFTPIGGPSDYDIIKYESMEELTKEDSDRLARSTNRAQRRPTKSELVEKERNTLKSQSFVKSTSSKLKSVAHANAVYSGRIDEEPPKSAKKTSRRDKKKKVAAEVPHETALSVSPALPTLEQAGSFSPVASPSPSAVSSPTTPLDLHHLGNPVAAIVQRQNDALLKLVAELSTQGKQSAVGMIPEQQLKDYADQQKQIFTKYKEEMEKKVQGMTEGQELLQTQLTLSQYQLKEAGNMYKQRESLTQQNHVLACRNVESDRFAAMAKLGESEKQVAGLNRELEDKNKELVEAVQERLRREGEGMEERMRLERLLNEANKALEEERTLKAQLQMQVQHANANLPRQTLPHEQRLSPALIPPTMQTTTPPRLETAAIEENVANEQKEAKAAESRNPRKRILESDSDSDTEQPPASPTAGTSASSAGTSASSAPAPVPVPAPVQAPVPAPAAAAAGQPAAKRRRVGFGQWVIGPNDGFYYSDNMRKRLKGVYVWPMQNSDVAIGNPEYKHKVQYLCKDSKYRDVQKIERNREAARKQHANQEAMPPPLPLPPPPIAPESMGAVKNRHMDESISSVIAASQNKPKSKQVKQMEAQLKAAVQNTGLEVDISALLGSLGDHPENMQAIIEALAADKGNYEPKATPAQSSATEVLERQGSAKDDADRQLQQMEAELQNLQQGRSTTPGGTAVVTEQIPLVTLDDEEIDSDEAVEDEEMGAYEALEAAGELFKKTSKRGGSGNRASAAVGVIPAAPVVEGELNLWAPTEAQLPQINARMELFRTAKNPNYQKFKYPVKKFQMKLRKPDQRSIDKYGSYEMYRAAQSVSQLFKEMQKLDHSGRYTEEAARNFLNRVQGRMQTLEGSSSADMHGVYANLTQDKAYWEFRDMALQAAIYWGLPDNLEFCNAVGNFCVLCKTNVSCRKTRYKS